MPYIMPHEAILFATHTGELYQRHLQLARMSGATLHFWTAHVRGEVMPLYRRQVDHAAEISAENMIIVATALREYYERHVKEF